MAKKKPQYQETSLFDIPTFWEPPTEEPSTMMRIEPVTSESPKEHDHDKQEVVRDEVRERGKRQRMRATFGDGDVICEANATATMIKVIKKLGIERVASLDMEVCHVPLVSRETVPRYARWTKEISDGWYLMAQSDTRQKCMQIKSIVDQLGENVQVEMGDFDQFVSDKNEGERHEYKGKSKFSVTFADGHEVCSIDHLQVFAETIITIGLDKVKKTHLQIAGKSIVTPEKKYNNQMRLLTGEWLTVPTQAKDKYKILRVLSSMTHTPYEVKIIE